jgi:hypothetical protein
VISSKAFSGQACERASTCLIALAATIDPMANAPEDIPLLDDESGIYVDQVRIVYRSVTSWSDPEPLATVVAIIDGGVQVDRDRLRREVELLHVDRTVSDAPTDGYILDERYHQHNWGASAATLEFIVQAAAYMVGSGIVGGAAWDGMKSIARRVGAAHGSERATEAAINGRTAERRAREMAAAAFPDITTESLTVLAVTLGGDSATVVLRASDGSTITAQPTLTDGGAIGPITRAYPGSGGGVHL